MHLLTDGKVDSYIPPPPKIHTTTLFAERGGGYIKYVYVSCQSFTHIDTYLSVSVFSSASYRQNGLSIVVHSFINSIEPPGSADISQRERSL